VESATIPSITEHQSLKQLTWLADSIVTPLCFSGAQYGYEPCVAESGVPSHVTR
jgi:hypothetical protein